MNESVNVVCPHCAATNRVPQSRLSDAPNCGRCKEDLFTGQPIDANASTFNRHVDAGKIPVLVDFWAAWCGPCKMMAPAYAAAAKQLEPGVRVLKVDTESEQGLGAKFNVRSIPTLMLFVGGVEKARQSGAMSETDIVRWTNAHL